jgi:hypothetical protein
MADAVSDLLERLENLKDSYGNDAGARKLELLRKLERRRLASAADVETLHEILCFLRAYPDDADVLACVERMLSSFASRTDLRRHRRELEDTGIAGTEINYRFFWTTAGWLARRWPDKITVDWKEFERKDRIETFLNLLVPYSETPALDMLSYTPRGWVELLKGPEETDAAFLARRFHAIRGDSFVREAIYEDVDVPVRLAPGPDTPARTRARYAGSPVVYQTEPLSRARPDLRKVVNDPPLAVRSVPRREARKLIDLAREAMVTRSRDLDAFSYADENDVRIVDCGRGLQFVAYGAIPERRLILESVYGFLTLRAGVPIGYVLASSLFRSTEVAYNVFETYRGAEAAWVFGRVLAMVRHLFGSEAFSIDPYQLGYGNKEGLASGAWWFYYKMGFRPDDPEVKRVLRGELKRMKARPGHRSDVKTLEQLASENVYLVLRKSKKDVFGRMSPGNVGLAITSYLAGRFGADRERGLRECSREAARLLGVRSTRGFSAGERLAWERWSPLVLVLPGVERWTRENKKALVKVIRAKGGRRESDYVRLFDAHTRLKGAVLKLARPD